MANERGNLLDRRKFHMMKSGSPRGMVGGKMRRPAGKAWWNRGSGQRRDQLCRLVWSLKWSWVEGILADFFILISVMPDWIGFKHNY